MKLALVAPNYAPHFEGGTERVVRAQARELARAGHEVRVVAGTDRPHAGHDVLESEVDGLPVAHLPRRDEPFDLALVRPRLQRLVEERVAGADVVHVHHWATLTSELVRGIAARAPVAVTFHDLFATCPRYFRTPPAAVRGADGGPLACPPRGDAGPCAHCIRPHDPGTPLAVLEERLAARAAGFEAEARAARLRLAPSACHARAVEALLGLPPESVRVLPHGLCDALAPAAAAGREPWRGQRPLRVLHLGHRAAAKGTGDLVRALAALPAGSVELVLAGSEVEAGLDAGLARVAGPLPLHFRGPYDHARLPALAAEADLAALPSRARESYGLVLDEALALGLPAWVSDRGALAERVGRAGRVLPAADPAAWTEAFRELLDDPALLAAERAAVPDRLPTARDAAATLERWYQDLATT